MTEFASVPAITLVCYFIGWCFKIAFPKLDKYIPIVCGLCGVILGVVVFYTIPGFIGATNWLTAVCIGIASGLSATGINQVYKQLTK